MGFIVIVAIVEGTFPLRFITFTNFKIFTLL